MRQLISEGMRYIIIGILTTVINLIVFKGMLLLHLHYLIATTIAFIVSVLFAYWTNRDFVFRISETHQEGKKLVLFSGSRVFTFALETIGLFVLISVISMDEMLSKLIMNGLVIVLNYMISKFWIFKRGTSREEY